MHRSLGNNDYSGDLTSPGITRAGANLGATQADDLPELRTGVERPAPLRPRSRTGMNEAGQHLGYPRIRWLGSQAAQTEGARVVAGLRSGDGPWIVTCFPSISRHPMLFSCQVAGDDFLLSGCGWSGGLVGECGFLVVVLAGCQAVVEAAEEAAEEVALGGGVPVAGVFAAVVVGAGAR